MVLLMSVAMCTNAQSTNQTQRNRPIAVGDAAPDFTLEDQNGKKITLSDARGKNPVVLVFYRGYW
jgi:cytochrome oxidase Cu insertion factor (SCO1/SenC/PrrC family)